MGWGDDLRIAAALPLSFTAVKTGTYTASNGEYVRCDVSAGSFTVTTPSSPTAGWRYGVLLTANASNDANALTVSAGNGPHDNVLYCADDFIIYEYDGSAWQTVGCYLRPHSVQMTLSADTTTNSADTDTLITYNTRTNDHGGIGDTSNSKIVIRRAGQYLVTQVARTRTSLTDGDFWKGSVWKNGTMVAAMNVSIANALTLHHSCVTAVLTLAANDYLQGYFRTTQANKATSSNSFDGDFFRAAEIR